jgi:hypothetical protein
MICNTVSQLHEHVTRMTYSVSIMCNAPAAVTCSKTADRCARCACNFANNERQQPQQAVTQQTREHTMHVCEAA